MSNFSTPSNITGVPELLNYSNRVSDFVFGQGMLLTFLGVIIGYLVVNKGESFSNASVAGTFMTMIFGVFFWIIGLVGDGTLTVYIVLFMGSLLWRFFK